MIKPIQALLKILHNNVILNDGTVIKVIKRPYPQDMTPCITIDNSGGTAIIQKNITNKEYIIPADHPQYDSNDPSQTISQQVIREERRISLELSLWCDTENQRDEIAAKVMELFYKVQSDYYKFCKNYDNGNCLFLDGKCQVNSSSGRGVKQQCPKPTEYDYENIFKQYDIIRATFDVTPPYILDDLTTNPPTLRSIIEVTFSYYDYHKIGGAVSERLTFNGELV